MPLKEMGETQVEATVYLRVVCAGCGDDVTVDQQRSGVLKVTPCSTCVDDARRAGYDAGADAARDEVEP